MRCIKGGLTGVAAVLLVCGAAYGQRANTSAGGAQNTSAGGHALDRNLMVGSGGVIPNRPDPIQQQIMFNNAVMYGTASGGKAFRGTLGYGAPNQFQNQLGSDDLYSFRRDSFPSAVTGMGVRGSDALRYQFAAVTGDRVPEFMGQPIGQLQQSATVPTSRNSTVLRSTSEFLVARSARPALVGVRQDEWGAEFVAKASPLLGVSWTKTRESPLEQARPNVNPTTGAPRETVTPLTGLETAAPRMANMMERDAIVAAGARRTADAAKKPGKTQAYQRLLDQVREETGKVKVEPVETKVKPVPDQPEVAPKPAAPEAQTLELQLERLRASMRGEVGPKTLKELKDLKAKRESEKAAEAARNAVPAPKSSNPRPGPAILPKDSPAVPYKRLSSEPEPTMKLESLSPELAQALKKSGEKKVDGLVDAPADTTTDLKDPEAYTELMNSGMHWLGRERYFDAEDRFTRALAAMPGDPMARVGRIHAQLGAGLLLSAAANLRTLLTDNPEMAGVRYGEKVLPSAERCRKVGEQCRFELERSASALQRDAALIMAYVGFQTQDAFLLHDGLAEFGKRIDADNARDQALYALISAAWGK